MQEYTLWCHQTWLAGKPPNSMEVLQGKSLLKGLSSMAMFDMYDYRRVALLLRLSRMFTFVSYLQAAI